MIEEAHRRIQACKESRSKILDLGNCGLTNDTIPDEIEELVWLRELNLGNNEFYDKLSKSWKQEYNRPSLKRKNRLQNIPPQISNLYGLRYLNLYANEIQHITNLDNLASLNWLSLSNNRIQEIKGLSMLTQLTFLWLSFNKIEKISGLNSLAKLTKLSLANNHIRKITGISALRNLRELHLYSNQIQEIKGLDNLFRLRELSLFSNRVCVFPSEIVEEYNCLPDLKAWQAALAQGKTQNKSVKIVLCGNSNVGKSCVLDALQGKKYKPRTTTHAIEIEKVELEEVAAWVWDMGGQEVYHGTHRLFMQSEAIYVLVWDAATEAQPQAPDRANADWENRNHKVPYWVDVIRAVSPESPILLVQNKIDTQAEDPTYCRKLVEDSLAISAGQRINIADLRHKLTRLAKTAKPLRYGMEVPSTWWAVRTQLLEHIAQRKTNKSLPAVISKADFEARCQAAAVLEKTMPSLLRLLHRSGVLFYQENNFGGNIILDQTWAIQAIYEVLDRRSMFFKRVHERQFFYQSELFEQWSDAYSPEDKKLLLGFMEQANLCFRISEYHEKEDPKYIIPRLLSPTQPPSVARIWARIKSGIYYLKYQHRHLHYGIIQQFLIRMGRKTALDMIWQNGIAFAMGENEALVIADFEQDSIRIQTHGPQALHLMQAIRKEFSDIYEQQEVEVSVSKDGKAYLSKEKLTTLQEYAPKCEQADLFWVLQLPNKEVDLRLDALPDVEQEVEQLPGKQTKAFICYAPEDEILKDKVYNSLLQLKYTYNFELWDDTQVLGGDVRDAEIAKCLQEADIIFVLLSTDFLSSNALWKKEVPQALARHQQENATLIPILLRKCMWELSEFAKLQPLPRNGEPINWDDEDRALYEVAEGVKKILDKRL